ncbi:MAG: TolB family protein, partial [Polyangiales bacterium]
TSSCGLTASDPTFGAFAAGTLTLTRRGGDVDVIASCDGAMATAKLHARLVGKVVASPGDDTPFATATPATDAARTPTIEYPIDGAVAPVNVPPVEVQWTVAGNDLFRVSMQSDTVSIDWYGKGAEATLSEADFHDVARSAAGAPLTITVFGLSSTDAKSVYASKPTVLKISHDQIDKTAIYYWASSTGNLMTQVFGNTGAPTSVRGDCTSCHSVSRAGTRVGYSRCVGGDCGELFQGFMKYDPGTKAWVDTMNANDKKVRGSYSTFAPVGYPFTDDKKSVALVSLNSGKLQLWDPDLGAPISSNAEDASSEMGAKSALMADWSPDGKSVVFAQTPHPGQWIDLSDSSIAMMSYAYDGTNHSFGTPKAIVASPLTLASGTYNNMFFPSFSADGKLIVFNAAKAAWRNSMVASAPGQRLALTDPTGSFKVELGNMNGPGDTNVTWPHWAPGVATDYYWVVFSTERPYGHKMNASLSPDACKQNGVQSCKQIWIGAIDRKLVGTGVDPSAAPVWMPGQALAANNISPYWTLPADSVAK